MINGLDLFSGIGGITIALAPWVRPVAYCENDRYAQSVLLSLISKNEIPNAPIWDDVRSLRASDIPDVDIIYGGFPCQDVSLAGARKGLDGERTGLFREAIRLVRECKPKFVFLENVPGIRKFVPTVREELEALGYDCRDGFLSAAEIGANHIRNRWWLLAYAGSKRRQQNSRSTFGYESANEGRTTKENHQPTSLGQEVADSQGKRWQGSERERLDCKRWAGGPLRCDWWEIEPNVDRVVNGLPARLDRLRALGNAVVPLQAREAFKILMGIA